MEIKYICEFVHLAKTCNYQETAAELYISQSALTRHIQAIEQELQTSLFNRTTRKVELNKYGEAFYAYAKTIADAYNDCNDHLRSMKSLENQSLNIGTLGFMNFYGLYNSLNAFRSLYPDINYRVLEGRDQELKNRLRTGEYSFVFTSNLELYPEFESLMWKRDEMVLICNPAHPLARHDTLELGQLRGYEIMIHGQPVDYTSFINACKASGFQPNVRIVSFSTTITYLASSDLGIAVINKQMCPTNNPNIVTIPLQPRISFNIHCVFSSKEQPSRAEKLFQKYIASDGEE